MADDVVRLVEEFCADRRVDERTRISMAVNLEDALRVLARKGPDRRWSTIASRGSISDLASPSAPSGSAPIERRIFEEAVRVDGTFAEDVGRRNWFLRHTVTSVAHWGRFSKTLREAHSRGVGWLIPAHRNLVVVPLPRMGFAEGSIDVLHNDAGSPAVEWSDGSGYHFLRGTHFSPALYGKVIGSRLSLAEVCLLPNVDQRSIALAYMTFEDLVNRAGAQLIDVGARGTRLYRLHLPGPMARDRPRGYGVYDYFIHMRDASHPEREFIEWVDPAVGAIRDAELCQAHAFGISLQDWLSIEQAG